MGNRAIWARSESHHSPNVESKRAPKARDIIARGKREARRPWLTSLPQIEAWKAEIHPRNFALSGLEHLTVFYQGRRAPRLPLATILRAVGAAKFRTRLALQNIVRAWRCKIPHALGAAKYFARLALQILRAVGAAIATSFGCTFVRPGPRDRRVDQRRGSRLRPSSFALPTSH